MVCLPLSRMMSSNSSVRRASSVSPGRGGRNSTNIGTITSGQPSRISERVPSKSKSTCLICGRGAKVGANSTRPRNPATRCISKANAEQRKKAISPEISLVVPASAALFPAKRKGSGRGPLPLDLIQVLLEELWGIIATADVNLEISIIDLDWSYDGGISVPIDEQFSRAHWIGGIAEDVQIITVDSCSGIGVLAARLVSILGASVEEDGDRAEFVPLDALERADAGPFNVIERCFRRG